ncbi:MAG: enoyl-CoA hydratase/isomerase family protein [Roseibium sp.]|uniref:enoyl-CoA hydratase-related protein n=1 Tax=Roseibium sp. TaxID=1936156 RepID=UPI002607FB09|nr:enoyl-CoA hydratase-related protein [Roseibium sp.]MCV0424986.1 enoyl-CoA hydratase/isomerase family protein [Roseibium sp.]
MTIKESSNSTNPLLNINGQVAQLTLNAPERKNALPLAAWQRIPEILEQVRCEPSVRICVVKGAGGNNFCAGADIYEFEAVRSSPDAAKHYDDINVAAFKAIKSLPVPVVAAIEGPCLGGGLGIALACDIRIAARSAFFGIPAAKLGLAYPPEALGDLLSAVPPADAKQLLFTGERIFTDKALNIGLINEIVEEGQLDQRIEELCKTICANAPLSLRAAKQAINQLSDQANHTEMNTALENAQTCIDSEDYREGCRAFLEKRPPVFKGC